MDTTQALNMAFHYFIEPMAFMHSTGIDGGLLTRSCTDWRDDRSQNAAAIAAWVYSLFTIGDQACLLWSAKSVKHCANKPTLDKSLMLVFLYDATCMRIMGLPRI